MIGTPTGVKFEVELYYYIPPTENERPVQIVFRKMFTSEDKEGSTFRWSTLYILSVNRNICLAQL